MEKLAYSVPELAKVLSIGRNAAYELANRADFPTIRIGERRIVVPIDALKIWIDRQAHEGRG